MRISKIVILNTTVIFKCPDCNAAIVPKEESICFSDALGKRRQREEPVPAKKSTRLARGQG